MQVSGEQARSGSENRAVLLRLAVLLVLLRAVFFAVGSPALVSDAKFYFPYAVLAVDGGRVPYRDFLVEYPPGSWPLMVWPRWWGPARGRLMNHLPQGDAAQARQEPSPVLKRAYAHYRRLFRWQMFLLDVAALVLMGWLLARHGHAAPLAFAIYGAGTLTLVPILYDRLDLGLWLLILLGSLLWLESWRPGEPRLGLLVAAAFCWGLGIAYKLVPVVAVPALAVALWRGSTSVRARLGALLAGAAGALGPFVLLGLRAGWHVLDFLEYHAQRGTQYESLWGALQMMLGYGGYLRVQVAEVAKAVDVQSSLAPLLVKLSYALTAASVLAVCWPVLRCRREELPRRGLVAAALGLLWLVAWGKVLSPQYFIWAGPVAVLVVTLGLPARWQRVGYLGVFAVWLLTAAIYPWGYLYWGLASFRLAALVLARNVLLVGLCGWLSWQSLGTTGTAG